MELRVLRYFLALAREENISKAAESLYITQPTLSRQLAELEEELGATLFIRGKRKITLTEEGMLLRRRAEEMVELEIKTENEFRQRNENLSGTVSIGAAGDAGGGNFSPCPSNLSAKNIPTSPSISIRTSPIT